MMAKLKSGSIFDLPSDPLLEIARGNIAGYTHVNKFGRSTNVDNGIETDIWDGSATIVVWVAPTQARTHQIASTSASDDGAPVGVGARTVRLYGLTAWTASEVFEDITLNGITDVPTVNAYVIIHRMVVLTKGATSVNVGVITATADTDATVTAQINAGEGQTQMAIYGVPSTQKAYMTHYYASTIKGQGATAAVAIELCVNPEPDVELLNFITKGTTSIVTSANNHISHVYAPYFKIPGPAIIKVQGNGTANDLDVSGGFDLILIDN